MQKHTRHSTFGCAYGFTLIEISIVLVIIGLIVGGILVGRDLIKAAEVRSVINQTEQYKLAANTFRLKYDYLPGDIPASAAAPLGFAARGTMRGEGDGNGVIEGSVCWMGGTYGRVTWATNYVGEPFLFWRDLSDAKLIAETFNTAPASCPPIPNPIGNAVYNYYPKINFKEPGANRIVVWSGGYGSAASPASGIVSDGKNYLAVVWLPAYYIYSMDVKLDDGLTQSGNFMAMGPGTWAGGARDATTGRPDESAAPLSSQFVCYGNDGIPGPTHYYTADSQIYCVGSGTF